MQFILFNNGKPGLLRDDQVIDIGKVIENRTGQEAMTYIITNLEQIRSDIYSFAD